MLPLPVYSSAAATPPTDVIWFNLVHYYLFFGISAAIIVIGLIFYFTIANRAPRELTKHRKYAYHPREHNWGRWKTILPIALITISVQTFVEYQTFSSNGLVVPPTHSGDPITVNVIGRQWDWEFTYPNGVSVVGNLTVPANEIIVLNITSTDVFHSFAIPSLSVAKDAIPGRYNTIWFNATQTGSFLIQCKELCGVGHALMTGHLTVVAQSTFDAWYSSLRVNSTSP